MSRVLSNLPHHNMYVELFSGKKSLLFKKLPLTSELYNDINKDIVCLFEVLRSDIRRFVEFLKTGVKPTEAVHLEKWDRLSEMYKDFTENVKRGSLVSLLGYRDISKELEKELNEYEKNLSYIVKRLRCVQFENRRFDDIINRFDSKDSLFYVDVTMLPEDTSEEELVYYLEQIQGKAILYGVGNEKYESLIDEGWIKVNDAILGEVWLNYKI